MRFDELPGGVADDHGAGLGLALQARRHVGGRPRDGGAVEDPRGQPGDHDGARMDADADGRLDAVATVQLDGGVRHPFDEPQRGQDRAPCVVLVRGGVAEARHDAVALELEHATAELLDGLRRHPAVEDEDVLDDLGLGHFGHVGRLDDVGEDQADEGPLASGQGALELRPLEHGRGALVRRIDGQHVVRQLDDAVPGPDRCGGVHRRQEPIDQERQPVLPPTLRAAPRTTSRRPTPHDLDGLGVTHVEEGGGLLAPRAGHERALVQATGQRCWSPPAS